MAFLNALAGALRSRSPIQATGAASPSMETTSATVSTGAREGGPPPTTGAPGNSTPTTEEEQEPSKYEKNLMLHLSNVSHAVNHFQNQMMTMLWPYIIAELGMSYIQVGVLSAISGTVNSICQGAYGFLTPFISRCKVLGLGNVGIALGTLMSGLAGSYPMLIVARGVAAISSSAQHPVGYSILARAGGQSLWWSLLPASSWVWSFSSSEIMGHRVAWGLGGLDLPRASGATGAC